MPPNRERDLPEYANRAGDPTFPPPYQVEQAGMDVLICDGDEEALGQLVERALNAPTERHYGTRDRLRFELASRRIGFACIDVQRMVSKPVPGQRTKSLDPLPDLDKVYARQTEVAVMVQIRDHIGLDYWYLPYVLNGLPAAVVSGREIYGYPKQHAVFAPDSPEPVWRSAGGVIFGPHRRWQDRCAVHAYDLAPKTPEEKQGEKDDEIEFALREVLAFSAGRRTSTLRSPVVGARPPRPRPDDVVIYPGGTQDATPAPQVLARTSASAPVAGPEPAAEEVAAGFLARIRSDFPFVFLRQFRDPEQEARASYQAMVLGRLVPSAMDTLQVVDDPGRFSVWVPWTYNLAFGPQLFGIDVQRGSEHAVPVVGMLSGSGVTFDVLRAAVLWQFPGDPRTDLRTEEAFAQWRDELLRDRGGPR
jgi:hypothetical protein